MRRFPDFIRILVVDGLGHGILAHEASAAATALTDDRRYGSPTELMEALHLHLRSTRGAAGSVADVRLDSGEITFTGLGNVIGVVVTAPGSRRQMLTGNGTLGNEPRKVQEFKYPFAPDSLVILHTDGLSANWSLDKYPGLFQRHPSVIAAVLFRDHRRTRDDATVVVVRPGSFA